MEHSHFVPMYYGSMQQQLPPMTPQMIVPPTMLPSPHHGNMALYLPQSPSHQSPHHLLHQMASPMSQQMTPNHQGILLNHSIAMQISNLQNQQNLEPETPVKDKNDKSSPMLYPMLYKTKMCKFHLLGVCEKGENCPHAHNSDEKRSRPDLSKTSLCRQLVNNGECRNQHCTFAHTKDELRATPNFFKMKKCKFFHSAQGCSFGEQCRYSHNADAESAVSPSQCGGWSPSGSPSISSVAMPVTQETYFRDTTYRRWKGHFVRNRQMHLRIMMDYVAGDECKVECDLVDFQRAFVDIKTLDFLCRVSIPDVNAQLKNQRIICFKVVPAGDADAMAFAEYIDYYQKRQRSGGAVMPNDIGVLYVLPVSLALQVKVLDNNIIASIGALMESRTSRQFLVGLWACGDPAKWH